MQMVSEGNDVIPMPPGSVCYFPMQENTTLESKQQPMKSAGKSKQRSKSATKLSVLIVCYLMVDVVMESRKIERDSSPLRSKHHKIIEMPTDSRRNYNVISTPPESVCFFPMQETLVWDQNNDPSRQA